MASVPSERRRAKRADDPELRGRRSEPRACLLLSASAEALSGNRAVTLLDVSRSGARVEGFHLPGVGRDIILRCGNIDAFGTIVWAASNRCGINFDEPVAAQDLVELRRLAAAAERSKMTPDEQLAVADWMNGLAR